MKNLFIRKSIHGHFEDVEDSHQLKRHLKLFHLVAIGIGAIIGAGIFVITGQAAALYAGPGIIFSFLIASIICIFTGLCYAELASMIPVSGGSYSYSYVALGEFPAWIVGWTITAEYLVVASTVAVGWSGYFTSILRDIGLPLAESLAQSPLSYRPGYGWEWTGAYINLPAIVLVALMGFFISFGIKAASRLNNFMVAIKLTTILVFILLGLFFIQSSNWTPFIPENTGKFGEFGWSGILRGAGLVFFAYLGFDTLATLAQESVHPQKDLPRAILGSLGICTLAYIATSLILTGIVSYTLLNVPDPIAVALQSMGKSFYWLKFAVQVAILAGLASVVLVQLMGQTRIFFAMSKDGLISSRFGKIHPHFQTPLFSCLMTTLFSLIIAGIFPLNILGELVSMAALFLFGVVCLGVLILRYTHPEIKRPFKVPFVPWIPLAGMLACLGQMGFFPMITWVQMIGWLLFGLLIYFLYSIKHSKLRKTASR